MVDPTKLKPRRFKSLLIASDSAVRAGTCLNDFGELIRGLPSDELPDVAVEAAELLLHAEKRLRIFDGGSDLQPVANDSRIRQELFGSCGVVLRDAFGIEAVEGETVIVALVQNRGPAQACLRAFENQEFEERAVVVHRHAPLFIVIANR